MQIRADASCATILRRASRLAGLVSVRVDVVLIFFCGGGGGGGDESPAAEMSSIEDGNCGVGVGGRAGVSIAPMGRAGTAPMGCAGRKCTGARLAGTIGRGAGTVAVEMRDCCAAFSKSSLKIWAGGLRCGAPFGMRGRGLAGAVLAPMGGGR